MHGGERPPQARRDAAGRHRRLDQQRAGAAAGIAHQTRAPCTGDVRDRGGQRLLDRRAARLLAVAALVQPRAAGVQKDRHRVVSDRELDLALAAALVEEAGAVRLPQPLDGGLFDDGLAVRHAVQLRIE